MNDTLKLQVIDWQIKDNNQLEVKPASYKLCSEINSDGYGLFEHKGAVVYGAKAYYNDSEINVTVAPLKTGEIGCFVQTSVPKITTGNNYYSVGRGGLQAGLNKIQKKLNEIGVNCNIQNAKVSRMDLFKNAILAEPFSTYFPVLSLLQMPRKRMRIYGDGFLLHSTNEELCIYNKIEEMRYQAKSIDGLPSDVGRFELRLLNSRTIQTHLGLKYAAELLPAYDNIKEFYNTRLKEKIFKYTPDNIEVLSATEIKELVNIFKNSGQRYWMGNFIKYYGIRSLLKDTSIETLKNIIKEVTEDRVLVHRLIKDLEKAEKDLLMGNIATSSKSSYRALYEEIKGKLVA